MARWIIRRAAESLLALWGILTVIFIVLHLGPDPITMLLPMDADKATAEALRRSLGLDAPLWEQYARFSARAIRGDLGTSLFSSLPALSLVLERLPATGLLVLGAVALGVAVGLPLGVVAAMKRGRVYGPVALVVGLAGQAAPPFWLGIMLVFLLAVKWPILPPTGLEGWRSLLLPIFTLGLYPIAQVTRVVQSSMIEILSEDYIRTARSKGLAERTVVWKHALRNAAIPIVTLVGVQIGYTFGATVVVETIFAWPGAGRLLYLSITNRDYPVVLAAALCLALTVLLTNLIVDLLYPLLDPKVRV